MIVCGTDFSKAAAQAKRVAAALARQSGEGLTLVHVAEHPNDDLRRDLRDEAQSITDLQVDTVVRTGPVDQQLIDAASGATLIVIGTVGHREGTHWLLGSTAERVAQHSPIPVLAIRRGEELREAIERRRRARVVVATDLSPDGEPVIRWAKQWCERVPSHVHLAYVANPAREQVRRGIPGRIDRHEAHPIVKEELTKELNHLAKQFAIGDVETGFTLTLGATSKELVRIAEEQKADLLIVGAHQRSRLTRAWNESVAKGVLHGAHTNVAVVPLVSHPVSSE